MGYIVYLFILYLCIYIQPIFMIYKMSIDYNNNYTKIVQ